MIEVRRAQNRIGRVIEECWHDLRTGLVLHIKNLRFTLLVVLILAVGIGSTTVVFSLVDSVLLRPLPLPHPEQVVMLWETLPDHQLNSVSYLNVQDWRNANRTFSGIALVGGTEGALSNEAGLENLKGELVDLNFFEVFGVRPFLGRTFLPEDLRTGILLSERVWRSDFGADPAIIGRNIALGEETREVVGVMPENFRYPYAGVQYWIPLIPVPEALHHREVHGYQAFGRLLPKVSVREAQADMDVIGASLAKAFPDIQSGWGVKVVGLQDQLVGPTRPMLLLLFTAVGGLLVVAALNFANLLLQQFLNRQRELAVKAALGLGQSRLLRQLTIQTVLLTLIGGIAGALLAQECLQLFTVLGRDYLPRLNEIRLNTEVLAFNLVLCLLIGVLCTFLAAHFALRSERFRLGLILQGETSRTVGTRGSRFLRASLVVLEVACAVTLLYTTGALLRSYVQLASASTGISNPDGIVVGWLELPTVRYPGHQAIAQFCRRFHAELLRHPEIESVGFIDRPPINGGHNLVDVTFSAGDAIPLFRRSLVETRIIGGDYYQTLGVSLFAGRWLEAGTESAEISEVLVNRALADRFFQGPANALGQRFFVHGSAVNVVGVVSDVRQRDLMTPIEPEVDFKLGQAQWDQPSMSIVAKGKPFASNQELISDVRLALRSIDPQLPLLGSETMGNVIADSISDRSLTLWVVVAFAFSALLLTTVGLYGVISSIVAEQTKGIGVRLALGANTSRVLSLILVQGLKLVSIGIVLGLFLAAAFSRLLESFLYQIAAVDPIVAAGVVVLVVLAALGAHVAPAMRAACLDPLDVLRHN